MFAFSICDKSLYYGCLISFFNPKQRKKTFIRAEGLIPAVPRQCSASGVLI
ncbi:hypothetical protein TREVI0001_1601 [Treponema vincentii ATCC 35580]|uniref:Uncharacterized protein n=1 Tax=Treponema vincentii ATCC 35580 TaxID=596324 RepID=C8PN94_9SPIR|nr:hypothetical protein TREVI0001_1601 [Treponema vincentii ATCC 35580]